MTRALLVVSLVASLAVPVGLFALVAAGGGGGATSSSTPSAELEKDEIVHLHNELVRIDQLATPGSKGHAREARRIARDAAAWAERLGAEPEHEWYEFANATSDVAQLLAQGIAGAPSFSEAELRRALARLDVAAAALPPERRPD
jgi:hypothetical protein